MGRCFGFIQFGFVQYGGYDLSDRLIAKASDVRARRRTTFSVDDLSDRLVIWLPAIQVSFLVGDQFVARILDFCLERGSSYCGRALIAPTTRRRDVKGTRFLFSRLSWDGRHAAPLPPMIGGS